MSLNLLAIQQSQVLPFMEAEAAILARMNASDSIEGDEEQDMSYMMQVVDDIAIVDIKGYLTNVVRRYNRYFGVVAYDEIRASIIQAIDQGAQAILFHVGSPGGRVSGMSDVANFMASLTVPTVTFTDETMASAALFLGLQSDEVYGDKFSEVGSVGVVMNVPIYSDMLKEMGIQYERFRTGDLKQAGAPYYKLTPKEKSYMQEQVQHYGNLFFQVVSDACGLPLAVMKELDITSGRTFIGQQGKDAGLLDGIITFDEAVAKTMQLAQKRLDSSRQQPVTFR